MRVYTARQPILNAKQQVVAYELLFRDSKINKFPAHVPADTATAKLLINSYLSAEFDVMTEGKPALVNFPINILKDHLLDMVPYKNIIVEVLEGTPLVDRVPAQNAPSFSNNFPMFVPSLSW